MNTTQKYMYRRMGWVAYENTINTKLSLIVLNRVMETLQKQKHVRITTEKHSELHPAQITFPKKSFGKMWHYLCKIWCIFAITRVVKVVIFYFIIPHVSGFSAAKLAAHHSRQIFTHSVVIIMSELATSRQVLGPLLRFPCKLGWPAQWSGPMSEPVLVVYRKTFFVKLFKSWKNEWN